MLVSVALLGAQKMELRDAGAAAAAQAPDENRHFAMELIKSAVTTAESCDPVSDGFLLLIAGQTIGGMDPARAKGYYLKSFAVAQGLGQPGARLVLQQNVVARMADLDLDRAVELLEEVDTPDITPHREVDARSDLGRTLATRLLERNVRGDPDKAVMLAEFLGDTGQFPYSAAREIMDYFHRHDQDERAAEILSEALIYFGNDLQFESSPARFVELILGAEGRVPTSILVNAIRSAVGTCGEKLGTRKPSREESAAASEFELPLLQRAAYVTAQLLSLAMRLDPPTAEKLKAHQAEIQQAIAKLTAINLTAVSSAPIRHGKAELMAQEGERLPEESPETELEKVKMLIDQSPLEALTLAEEIEAPGYRSLALAAVGECLARRDPQTAIPVLRQAEDSMRQTDPAAAMTLADLQQATGIKVEALTKIAETWISLGLPDRASVPVSEGYTEVLGFLDQQAAASSTVESGLDTPVMWLGGLARLEASLSPAQAVKRIELISSPRLRAYALLSVGIEILQGVEGRRP
jgi:hypothetical protein